MDPDGQNRRSRITDGHRQTLLHTLVRDGMQEVRGFDSHRLHHPDQGFCDRSDYEDEVGVPNGVPNSDES